MVVDAEEELVVLLRAEALEGRCHIQVPALLLLLLLLLHRGEGLLL